jgi:BCD family chlorophyll transporter-like MFS transporter
LGLGNGVYAAAAIGAMMGLAAKGARDREGTRMGLWGAAQALAMGAGGVCGAAMVDLARAAFGAPLAAYALVFGVEALAFVASALLAGPGAAAKAPAAPLARIAPLGT